jgi:hypothetical protein
MGLAAKVLETIAPKERSVMIPTRKGRRVLGIFVRLKDFWLKTQFLSGESLEEKKIYARKFPLLRFIFMGKYKVYSGNKSFCKLFQKLSLMPTESR